jgi:hypothetical protein
VIIIAGWWWLGWVAKLTLELLLCYAIMLVYKNKLDKAQSKAMKFIAKLFKITPNSRLGGMFNKFNTQSKDDDI